jgi:SEC-C motif-containing protein
VAQTAEQLMRSRYSAYALKQIDYLLATTHPEKRSANLRQEITAWANAVEFYSLEILTTWKGQAADKVGKVKFIARYHQNGEDLKFCELSRFRRVGHQWRYLDGEVSTDQS